MRVRLRDPLGPAAYQVVRDNRQWPDHVARTLATAALVAWLEPETVCDPACGDASVVIAAHRLRPIRKAYLGDISAPAIAALWGTDNGFEANLATGDAISNLHTADVVVLTEILEHLEDPEQLLIAARMVGTYLIASSPVAEKPESNNHEHVWAWDRTDYRDMLEQTGWTPVAYQEISLVPAFYTFGIWACS